MSSKHRSISNLPCYKLQNYALGNYMDYYGFSNGSSFYNNDYFTKEI